VIRRRHLLWSALAVVLVAALAFGTGGFTSASMDRGANIGFAPNDQALVSVWDPGAGGTTEPPEFPGEDPIQQDETASKIIVVKNRLSSNIDLQVTDRTGSSIDVDGNYANLAPGEIAPIEAAIDCNGHTGSTNALLTIRASTDGGEFTAIIPFKTTVVCLHPPKTAGNSTTP